MWLGRVFGVLRGITCILNKSKYREDDKMYTVEVDREIKVRVDEEIFRR
jgi:hypothetical protein